MNFKDEIKPILKACKIFDFVGKDKYKVAERLCEFVKENCQLCQGMQQERQNIFLYFYQIFLLCCRI